MVTKHFQGNYSKYYDYVHCTCMIPLKFPYKSGIYSNLFTVCFISQYIYARLSLCMTLTKKKNKHSLFNRMQPCSSRAGKGPVISTLAFMQLCAL